MIFWIPVESRPLRSLDYPSCLPRSAHCKTRSMFSKTQIKGWIFAHAATLVGDSYSGREHSGIAVLMLASSYFEMIGGFLAGK